MTERREKISVIYLLKREKWCIILIGQAMKKWGNMKKRKKKIISITIVTTVMIFFVLNIQSFPDLIGHWSEKEVDRLNVLGITAGYEDGNFYPQNSVTRAEFVKMLVSALGYANDAENLKNTKLLFSDLGRDHWANGTILAAYELGILEEKPGEKVRPDDKITRLEIIAMLMRSYGNYEPVSYKTFADQNAIPSAYRKDVASAVELGFVTGFPDDTLRPEATATRSESAAMIHRLMRKKGLLYDYIGTFLQGNGETFTLSVNGQAVDLKRSNRNIRWPAVENSGSRIGVILDPAGMVVDFDLFN